MIWAATLFIGLVLGAMIMFVGLAIGREMGRREFSEYDGYTIISDEAEVEDDGGNISWP